MERFKISIIVVVFKRDGVTYIISKFQFKGFVSFFAKRTL